VQAQTLYLAQLYNLVHRDVFMQTLHWTHQLQQTDCLRHVLQAWVKRGPANLRTGTRVIYKPNLCTGSAFYTLVGINGRRKRRSRWWRRWTMGKTTAKMVDKDDAGDVGKNDGEDRQQRWWGRWRTEKTTAKMDGWRRWHSIYITAGLSLGLSTNCGPHICSQQFTHWLQLRSASFLSANYL